MHARTHHHHQHQHHQHHHHHRHHHRPRSAGHAALRALRAFSALINPHVGDAITDALGVLGVLCSLGWTPEQWDALYEDLPNSLDKCAGTCPRNDIGRKEGRNVGGIVWRLACWLVGWLVGWLGLDFSSPFPSLMCVVCVVCLTNSQGPVDGDDLARRHAVRDPRGTPAADRRRGRRSTAAGALLCARLGHRGRCPRLRRGRHRRGRPGTLRSGQGPCGQTLLVNCRLAEEFKKK
jgi:hypothetical protein